MEKGKRWCDMKRLRSFILWFVATALVGCNLSSGGEASPNVWMDRPLNGETFPLAPIIIQAHASDVDGVSAIEFYLADSLLASVPAGGGRLGEASIQWTPSAPGNYTVRARAVDNQGNIGPSTEVQIVVGAAGVTTETTTTTPASLQCEAGALVAPTLLSPADGATVESEPVLAWSYPDATCHPHSYRIDISEDASFADISLGFGTLDYNETSRSWPLPPGKCYYWRTLAYVPDVNGPASPTWRFCVASAAGPSFTLNQNANCRAGPGTAYESLDVLMQGQTVSIEGRNSDSTWFWVRKPSGSGNCWLSAITGESVGDLSAVPIVSAPPLPTQPPTVEVDTTPPNISNYYASPVSIQQQGCGEPSTTIVSASVSDAGGVGRVMARIPGYGEVEMTHVGGGAYQATVGPFSGTGEFSIFIFAWDNAGNGAQAGPFTIMVACIG